MGDTVSFSGSATDNQGAAIPPSNLTWKLVLKHGACPDCHDHFLQTYSGVSSGSFKAPDHDYPSELELTLTATDARGLSQQREHSAAAANHHADVPDEPDRAETDLQRRNATAPFSRTVIVGSTNSVSAPSPQNPAREAGLPVLDRRSHDRDPHDHRADERRDLHGHIYQEVTGPPRPACGKNVTLTRMSTPVLLRVRDDFPAPATRPIDERTGDGSDEPAPRVRGMATVAHGHHPLNVESAPA